MKEFAWLMVMAATLLAVGGCSSFDRDFEAARKGEGAVSAWEGAWQSNAGHGGGAQRAILTKQAPNAYTARFRSTYGGFLNSEDEVTLNVSGTDPIKAAGEADLGYFKGGVYQYDATITDEKFDATYKSKADHGWFNLTRKR